VTAERYLKSTDNAPGNGDRIGGEVDDSSLGYHSSTAPANQVMGTRAMPCSESNLTSDGPWTRLRRIHWLSWLAGGIVAAALLDQGTPDIHFLTAFVRPGFCGLTDLLRLAEPFALVASTVYVVECPIRRIVSQRRFSLRGFFLAVVAILLVIRCAVVQYRSWRAMLEFIEQHPTVDADPPGLVFAPWPVRVPLLLGAYCLAYVIVEGAWWVVWKAMRFMTSNWERSGGPDDR
jgi:hypothetical protein